MTVRNPRQVRRLREIDDLFAVASTAKRFLLLNEKNKVPTGFKAVAAKYRATGDFFVLDKSAADADAEMVEFLQQIPKSVVNGQATIWPTLLCFGMRPDQGGFSGIITRGGDKIYFKKFNAALDALDRAMAMSAADVEKL